MPEYLYIDANDHTMSLTHRLNYSTGIICLACGERMWRKPQAFMVNWSGLRPSQGELSPRVRGLLSTKEERQDAFTEKHEHHERNH